MKTMRRSFLVRLSLVFASFILMQSVAFARQDSTRYPLIVDFFSVGGGVPGDQPLKNFIVSYRKKNKLKPFSAIRAGGLGREGEYAILFLLKELNARQRKQFIGALSKALPTLTAKEENGGINLNENQPFDISRGRTEPQKITL